MNELIEAKKSPEVKPWVRRVVEASGVWMSSTGTPRAGVWNRELLLLVKDGR